MTELSAVHTRQPGDLWAADLQSESLSQNTNPFPSIPHPVILHCVNRPTSTLLLSTMKKSCQSRSPFGENDAGSQATFDLHKEDEEVRLHEGARWCSLLIVMTHAGPQRGTNIFNASNFCAAATIPGSVAGFFCGSPGTKAPLTENCQI